MGQPSARQLPQLLPFLCPLPDDKRRGRARLRGNGSYNDHRPRRQHGNSQRRGTITGNGGQGVGVPVAAWGGWR